MTSIILTPWQPGAHLEIQQRQRTPLALEEMIGTA